MRENIRTALRGIRAHRLRSFLTMLGVIIGIASIITIVSIVEGTSRKLEKSLIGSGNNVMTMTLCEDDYPYDMSRGVPSGVGRITEEQLMRIGQIKGTQSVATFHSRGDYGTLVTYGKDTLQNCRITGVDHNYLDTVEYRLISGRNFREEDFRNGAKAAVVDDVLADVLFDGTDAVGMIIEVQQEPYQIIGVVRDTNKKTDEDYENQTDYYMNQSDNGQGQVYVPDATWPVIFGFDEPVNVAIRVDDPKQMSSIGKQAGQILDTSIGDTSGNFSYADPSAQADEESLKTITNAIQLMLVAIASLSLLVGGIGVMNIMLVSVSERTPEIGLKKALGAKRRTILAQFLTESAVLTGVGGIIGIILGIVLARIITFAANLPMAISVPWVLISAGFSIGIGLIFGAMPANRAAKLNPIDALRRE